MTNNLQELIQETEVQRKSREKSRKCAGRLRLDSIQTTETSHCQSITTVLKRSRSL